MQLPRLTGTVFWILLGAQLICAEPPNSRLALIKDGDIYVAELPKGQPARITNYNNKFRNTRVDGFSANGRKILYSVYTDELTDEKPLFGEYLVPDRNHYVMDSDGSDRRLVYSHSAYGEFILSPDAQFIALIACDDASCEGIEIIKLYGGSTAARIPAFFPPSTKMSSLAVWSQDSKRIYYFQRDPEVRAEGDRIVEFDLTSQKSRTIADHLWLDGSAVSMLVSGNLLIGHGYGWHPSESEPRARSWAVIDIPSSSTRIMDFAQRDLMPIYFEVKSKTVYASNDAEEGKKVYKVGLLAGDNEKFCEINQHNFIPTLYPARLDNQIHFIYSVLTKDPSGSNPGEFQTYLFDPERKERTQIYGGFELGAVWPSS